MLSDFYLILCCWFLISLWQILSLPILYKLFKDKLYDGGWGLGRTVTWLSVGSLVWFTAHLGLPTNTNWFIYGSLLIFGLLALWWGMDYGQAQKSKKKNKKLNFEKLKDYFWAKRKIILAEEIVFLSLFVFLALTRGYNPDINGLEKFMDAGIMASYLRSPKLPLEDMWLAGEKINYYTFGHFLGSVVTHYWSISIDLSYNLLLALLMGLVGISSFSLAVNLAAPLFDKANFRKLVGIGLVATFLITLAGNGHTAWYLLKNRSAEGYWYPDATRFIERTIHEYPAYSFVVSDLHAHVWGLPLVFWLVTNIFVWLQEMKDEYLAEDKNLSLENLWNKNYFKRALLIGLSFGLIMSTSTWDLLIYGLFLGVLGVILLIFDRRYFLPLVKSAVVVGLGCAVTASAWFLNFESISEGVKIADEHSPLWQLLVLWGPHWLISLLSLFLGAKVFRSLSKKQSSNKMYLYQFVLALGVTATLLIILPELIYMKDIYPDHPRANTMFKLMFQGFTMMCLLVSWLVGVLQNKYFSAQQQLFLKLIMIIFVVAVGIYPKFSYPNFYGGYKKYKGLDGAAWLKNKYADDYAAIKWLRRSVSGRPVVLEAVGESYTEFARVSTYTGLPTVLGWRVHEWLWRGGFDIPAARTEEVKTIYEQPLSREAQGLISKYDIKYIFVGAKEREQYELDDNQLEQLGEMAFVQGKTFILEL